MNPYSSPVFLPGRTDRVNQLAHVSLLDGANNTSVGVNTGYVRGHENTIVGAYAGVLDARSSSVVLLGERVGSRAQTAVETVAIGAQALSHATLTQQSVFVGAGSAANARNAALTTAVGHASGARLSTALRSTLVGALAGERAFNTLDDTFVGYASGRFSREGDSNACLGAFSGSRLEVGSQNVLVGYKAGANIQSAQQCVAVGALALEHATDASNVIAIGMGAGQFAAGAHDAIFIGGAGGSGGGGQSVSIGMGSSASGNNNTTVGYNAGQGSTGGNNTSLGANAGPSGDSSFCTAVGYSAAAGLEGTRNVVVGANTAVIGQASNNVVVGADTMPVLDGDDNVVVGTNIAIDKPLNNSILVGSRMVQDHDFRGLSNAVIVGDGATLSNRDSDTLVLITPGLGEVMRASDEAVSFGTGILVTPDAGVDLWDPATTSGYLLNAAYAGDFEAPDPSPEACANAYPTDIPMSQVSVVVDGLSGAATTDLWYAVAPYAAAQDEDTALDGLYGPADSTVAGASLFKPLDLVEPPDQSVGWAALDIRPVRIQGMLFDVAYVHWAGMISFGNSQLDPPTEDRLAGPTLYFASQPGANAVHYRALLQFPLGPSSTGPVKGSDNDVTAVGWSPTDHVALPSLAPFPSQQRDHLLWNALGGEIIRWERVDLDTGEVRVAEVMLFHRTLASTPDPEGEDTVVRLAWNGGTWPLEQLGCVYFAGLDGCCLGALRSTDDDPTLVYFFPKCLPPVTAFTSWAALYPAVAVSQWTEIQLAVPLALFNNQYSSVFVSMDGSISFGAASTDDDVPQLHIGKHPLGFYNNYNNAVSKLVDARTIVESQGGSVERWPAVTITDTRIRVELTNIDDNPFVYEVVFTDTLVTVVYSDTFTAAATDSTFLLTYKGASFPIPHSSKRSYTLSTNDVPPHMFAGGRVRISSDGILLQANTLYQGDGGLLSNIQSSAIVWSDGDGPGGGGGGGGGVGVHWDDPGDEHLVPWADVATQLSGDTNSLGYVVVSASTLALTGAKQVTSLLAVTRNSGGVGLSLLHTSHQPGGAIGTFKVKANSDGLQVLTDADCRVSVSPLVTGGTGSGSSVVPAQWDGVGAEHAFPWTNVATQFLSETNSLGYLVVSASTLALSGAKQATCLLSVTRNSNGVGVSVLHASQQPGSSLATFQVQANEDGLKVVTDADCRVSVSPVVLAGVIDGGSSSGNVVSSAIEWDSDLVLPAPYMFVGNGGRVSNLRSANLIFDTDVVLPSPWMFRGNGGRLSNLRSANLVFDADLVLPSPWMFRGNGGRVSNLRSSNLVFDANLVLPSPYVYSGDGGGLANIPASAIVGMPGTDGGGLANIRLANVVFDDDLVLPAPHQFSGDGGRVSNIRLSNLVFDANLVLPSPWVFTGDGGGLANIPASAIVGMPGTDGGGLANLRSSNLVIDNDLVLPSPYVYTGDGGGLANIPASAIVGMPGTDGGGLSNIRSANLVFDSDIILPSPYVLSGDGGGLANIPASAIVGMPGSDGGGLANIRSSNLVIDDDLVLPAPYVYTGDGGRVSNLRLANVVFDANLVLPSPYVYTGDGGGLANIPASAIVGTPGTDGGGLANIRLANVVFDDDLVLPSPYVYTGDGGGLANIPASAIVGMLGGEWDAPSDTHLLPWADVATHLVGDSNNSVGYVVVSVSNLATVQAKHATALLAITRNSQGVALSLAHMSYLTDGLAPSPVTTFQVQGSSDGLTVLTDADCSVCVSPLATAVGRGTDLHVGDVTVDGLLRSSKANIITGFGGGPRVSQGGWDAPANVHTLSWTQLADGSDDVTGSLVVHASSKNGMGKNGVAQLLVVKGVGANTSMTLMSQHASPNLTTLNVAVAGDDIQVDTDPECAVCWTFLSAC